VVAPKLNEQDTRDFPEPLLDDVELVFAEHVRDVLDVALEDAPARKARARSRRPRVATPERRAARPAG